MAPLFWLASYAAVGLCLGLAIAIFYTVKTWKKGEDLTLGNFGMLCAFLLLMPVLWPVVVLIAVFEWISIDVFQVKHSHLASHVHCNYEFLTIARYHFQIIDFLLSF